MYNRYYEDFVVGETHKTDDVEVTKQEILEFGQKYDPLPFHIDEETAAETPFNGVIASGLQTFALSQKQVVDSFFRESHLLGSVGFDEAEFPNPVRPGDILSTTLEILEKRPSKSNPSRGLVTIMRKVVNQHDSVVLRVTNNVLVERQ